MAGVGAAGRLGDRHEALLAAKDAGHAVLLALRLGPEPDHRGRVDAEGTAGWHVGPHAALGGLLGHDDLAEEAKAAAAIFLGRGHAPEPGGLRLLAERLELVGWKGVAVVGLALFDRTHLLHHEATDRVAQHGEVFGELPGAAQLRVQNGHRVLI